MTEQIRWSSYGVILGVILFLLGAVLLMYNVLTGAIIDISSIHIMNVYIMVVGLIVFGFSSYYYIRYDMWGE